MRSTSFGIVLTLGLCLASCSGGGGGNGTANSQGEKAMTFQEDVEFLKKHVETIVLTDGSGPAVAVVPDYQCRVMTSAFSSDQPGIGWINYDLVASGEKQPHINVYGGEDRLWLGPEGGQFAIFFKKGDPFTLEAWQTPAVIDTEPFDVVTTTQISVACTKTASLVNYSGTRFDFRLDRTVRFLSPGSVDTILGVTIPEGVKVVAYETENTITNIGKQPWTKEGGLLSIWILGMYKHSPTTTVVIPFREGPDEELGAVVNDEYFGKVPADRLKVVGNLILFKADGHYRSKIGVPPERALPIIGSYDPARELLTIVSYSLPRGASDYVNSMWEIQDDPFGGDVVNSYNDGPPEPGKPPLGPFYELETSSPAAALEPNRSLTHMHQTFHFTGSKEALQSIAQELLGADLDQVAGAFK